MQNYKSIDTDLIAELRCHLGRIGKIVKTTLISSLLRVALIWMNQCICKAIYQKTLLHSCKYKDVLNFCHTYKHGPQFRI